MFDPAHRERLPAFQTQDFIEGFTRVLKEVRLTGHVPFDLPMTAFVEVLNIVGPMLAAASRQVCSEIVVVVCVCVVCVEILRCGFSFLFVQLLCAFLK